MKRFLILMALIGTASAFAKDQNQAEMAKWMEQDSLQQISQRKQDLEGVKDCAELKLRLTGILSELAADAQSLAADAMGSADSQRTDEMTTVYRKMMPLKADSLSVSLSKLTVAVRRCEFLAGLPSVN